MRLAVRLITTIAAMGVEQDLGDSEWFRDHRSRFCRRWHGYGHRFKSEYDKRIMESSNLMSAREVEE